MLPKKDASNESMHFGKRSGTSSTEGETTSSSTDSKEEEYVTILGVGSLLSELSARCTFPELYSFRTVRVPNYRRVFSHPAPIFIQRGIGDVETLDISSLCAERDEGNKGLVATAFEIPADDFLESGVPSRDFLEREHEFDIRMVPFIEESEGEEGKNDFKLSEGILCTKSTDDDYMKKWGREHFEIQYGQYGIKSIWDWGRDSGLRPCGVYLRHCIIAAKKMGNECYTSFLDETFLVDRTTTIREYLEQHADVMNSLPPPALASRYGG
mmetsp:Transcript_27987/g.39353  ORF Transcript_27987/g.39353 Transcript_27987/m.39353 type:complete len:269 (-) Transcript_27987:481-1287(-)